MAWIIICDNGIFDCKSVPSFSESPSRYFIKFHGRSISLLQLSSQKGREGPFRPVMDVPRWVWGVAAEGGGFCCRTEVGAKAATKLEKSFFGVSRASSALTGGCFVVTSRLSEEALLPWSLP